MNVQCSVLITALGANNQVRIVVESAGAYTLTRLENGDYQISDLADPLTQHFHVSIYPNVQAICWDNDGRPDRPIIVPKAHMEDKTNVLCVRFPD